MRRVSAHRESQLTANVPSDAAGTYWALSRPHDHGRAASLSFLWGLSVSRCFCETRRPLTVGKGLERPGALVPEAETGS